LVFLGLLSGLIATALAVASAWAASPPYYLVSPPNKAFGDLAVGSTASQTFTLTNAGGRQTGVLQDSISGTGAAEYAMTSESCSGRRLRPGESCAITVIFAPTAAGIAYAQVNITADNPPGGAIPWLSGTGI